MYDIPFRWVSHPHALRAIPTSRPLYKSRHQNRIIVTSFAALVAAIWTNFDVWSTSKSKNFVASFQVRYHDLDVTCARNNNFYQRGGVVVPTSQISVLKNVFFIWKQHIFASLVTHWQWQYSCNHAASCNCLFHSYPITTCLFDTSGKRGSSLETIYSYLLSGLQDNSPINQLAVTQVTDWITRRLVNSSKCFI